MTEYSSNEGASSLVSRAISQAASKGSTRLYISDTSIFSLGDSIVINKGTSVEETNSITSKTSTYLEISDELSNDHETGAFVEVSSSLGSPTIVSENSVVTDTLVVGDPDQSGEENVFSIENGNVSAEGDVNIQGDLDVQGAITVQGESINNGPSSEELSELPKIANALTEGLSGVAEALKKIEKSHSCIDPEEHHHHHHSNSEEHHHHSNSEEHHHHHHHHHHHNQLILNGSGIDSCDISGISDISGIIASGISGISGITGISGVSGINFISGSGSGIFSGYTPPFISPNYAKDPTSPCPNTGYYLRVDECVNCYFEENLNQIGALAKQLVEFEFDYITGEGAVRSELYTISGSLSGRIGELNVLLNQGFCFTGCDGNPYPRLGKEEGDILQQLYMRDYNTKQAQKIMRGLYDGSAMSSVVQNEAEWTELSEGDTTIRRSPGSSPSSASNRIALSKDFKALSEDADRKIKQLVYNYNMYGSQPRQVAGEDGAYEMIVRSRKDY